MSVVLSLVDFLRAEASIVSVGLLLLQHSSHRLWIFMRQLG